MNSEISKISKPYVLIVTDKIDLQRHEKTFIRSLLVFTIHGKTKKSCNNNKFIISAPTWNDEFELTDESYSIISDIEIFKTILSILNKMEKRLLILQ